MLCLCAQVFAMLAAAQGPLHEAEEIFPPNPQHNHGSSIVETPSGDLMASWFHGTGERRNDDVLIQGARKRSGATQWCEPFTMADSQDLPDCNSVLFVDPRGVLWLFWVAVLNNEWGSCLLKYRTASEYGGDGPPKWDWQDVIHCRPLNLDTKFPAVLDEAETKYAALLAMNEGYKKEIEEVRKVAGDKLSQRLGWMTRLHPIMTGDSRMMLGLYSDVFNCSLAAFTEDWGKTWQFSEPILTAELGNIQPSFVSRKDGGIAAFMRDNGIPKRIRRAVSQDKGVTWGPVDCLDIPNPGSSVECIALASGSWVLVCNDALDGRHRLTAYLSDDEGASWKWKRAIEEHEKDAASASYPSVIQTRDGLIHCTYSFSRKEVPGSTIKHAWFSEAWLREKAREAGG